MMPLIMANAGEVNLIKKVGGNEKIRRFLESLGFVVGADVTVVAVNHGNVIVNIKESRVAISREMAIVRKTAPLGDPVEVKVRGYELSLRKADAEMIEVG